MPPMKRKEAAASSKAMQIVDSKKLKKDQDLFDAVDNLIGAFSAPSVSASKVQTLISTAVVIFTYLRLREPSNAARTR